MKERELNSFNEIPEFFPWEPSFNKVVITLNTEEVDNNLVLSDNTMSEQQYVVAKGPHVAHFDVGDKVLIDIEKMIVTERDPNDSLHQIKRIKIDPIEHEGVMYGLIEDRFIKAKYKG